MKNLWLYILLTTGISLSAQPNFKAVVDTQQIKIGEPITLKLMAEIPIEATYQWPLLEEFKGFEILSIGKIDSLLQNEQIILSQELRLTSFDSGDVFVSPLHLKLNGDSLHTDSIPILVYYPNIKEGQELFDIKSPREIPFNYWLLVYWAIGGIIVLILLYYLMKYIRKKPGIKDEKAIETKIPPGEWALKKLDELEAAKLWEEGNTKGYYSELVDILRIYLERKFALKAMESTADELIIKIKPLLEDEDLFRSIKQSLQISALVKYARHRSLAQENTLALEAIRNFIKLKEAPKIEDADV